MKPNTLKNVIKVTKANIQLLRDLQVSAEKDKNTERADKYWHERMGCEFVLNLLTDSKFYESIEKVFHDRLKDAE